MKKMSTWQVKGMNQDMSVSKFSPEFAFENMNLRLSTNESNTYMSWVNEKGTLSITLSANVVGNAIGTAILKDKLVLFTTTYTDSGTTHDKDDHIYTLKYNSDKTAMTVSELFHGNLNFYVGNPLETLVSYEAEHIKKVYWVDGRNQPRIINIEDSVKLAKWQTASDSATGTQVMTFFDFVPTTNLQESVTITRAKTGGEMFAPGVIQYAFTYINKYAQQTNIVYVSPLYYLTHSDRGASPEEEVVNAFDITVTNPDRNFDYLRLYSIQRTSIDDTPIVKMLDDIPVPTSGNITYTDNGTAGYAMDPTELLYVGGHEIIANTLIDKDNTLFVGNFSEKNASVNAIQKRFDTIRNTGSKVPINYTTSPITGENTKTVTYAKSNDFYSNTNTLTLGNRKNITTFKGGETYRFGFQLQKATGEWSDPIFMSDEENTNYPDVSLVQDSTTNEYVRTTNLVYAQSTLNITTLNADINSQESTSGVNYFKDYVKIRPVIVYPTVGERTVLCQGVLNPTVFNLVDRLDNSPYSQASWYFRPYMINTTDTDDVSAVTASIAIDLSTVNYEGVLNYNKTEASANKNFASEDLSSYNILIVEIPQSKEEEILSRKYLKYRQIIYAEKRYTGGAVEMITSSSGNMNYMNTPWNGTQYFDAAIKIGNVSGSPFNNTAYILFYSGTFAIPYVDQNMGENQGEQGDGYTMHHYYSLEYDSTTSFSQTPSMDNKNYNFLIYGNLKLDRGFFYYTQPSWEGEGTNPYPSPYQFKLYYKYGTGACSMTITMPSQAADYAVVRDNKEGNGVEFVHYMPLPTDSGAIVYENQGGVNVPIGGAVGSTFNKRSTIEIQGSNCKFTGLVGTTKLSKSLFPSNTSFYVDQSILTLNSPDIEFDSEVQNYDTENLKMRIVGVIPITSNASAHRITTSSSMLETSHGETTSDFKFGTGETGNNIMHRNIDIHAGQRLVADYMWNDSAVVSDTAQEDKIATGKSLYTFLVHPWQRQGSLNNDVREEDVAASTLKTKRESNILYSLYSKYLVAGKRTNYTNIGTQMHLTENNYVLNLKLSRQLSTSSEINYYPNIDKVLYNTDGYTAYVKETSDFDIVKDMVQAKYPTLNEVGDIGGLVATVLETQVSEYKSRFSMPKITKPISMKYRSTSHAVIALNAVDNAIPVLPSVRVAQESNPYYRDVGVGRFIGNLSSYGTLWGDTVKFSQNNIDFRPTEQGGLNVFGDSENYFNFLWLAELYKDVESRFGGDGESARKNNKWQQCGPAIDLPSSGNVELKWLEGDTFYQRYDCLKTYPFTEDDTNQLVEILSFMCESRVNIDGRYDRNRGQMDNTLMRPGNFNLLNPVYSQRDNFFTSRKVNTDNAELTYPNMVTYSKTKTSGADVDLYTNVTLASVLELDGDKGDLNKIVKVADQLIAFQDTGISRIKFNSNVAIATQQGVPVELANSGKVDGKEYISDTVGCNNKWSIVTTPSGVYFMNSHDKSIYLFNGQLQNLSVAGGMNSWSKKNIPDPETPWTPTDNFNNFVSYYDKLNQEVLFINKDTALAFSEKPTITAFTSFYDYGNTPYFCNLEGTGLWLRRGTATINNVSTPVTTLWKHQAGSYNNFFGTNKPYWTTLIGNPEPTTDKIFTNLEFRADVEGEGTSAITPYLPFDSLETWNEYQHGSLSLATLTGSSAFKHFPSTGNSSLKRKFRMWRCDIPRDNAVVDPTTETPMGIKRFARHPVDRMRNPWLYLKLKKNAATSGTLNKTEIHDVVMTYFS